MNVIACGCNHHDFNPSVWIEQHAHFVQAEEHRAARPLPHALAGMVHVVRRGAGGFDPCDVNAPVGGDACIEVNHVSRRFKHGLFDPAVVVVHGHEHGRGIVIGVHDNRARSVVEQDLDVTCSVCCVHLNVIRQVRVHATGVCVRFVEQKLDVIVWNGVGGRVAQGLGVAVAQPSLRGSAPTLDLRVSVVAVAEPHQARKTVAHFETHQAADVQTRHGRSGAQGFEV